MGCPLSYLTPDVHRFLELLPLAEKGTLPVGGGVLDQTASFLEAWRYWCGLSGRITAAIQDGQGEE